jgi:hypothetical protein
LAHFSSVLTDKEICKGVPQAVQALLGLQSERSRDYRQKHMLSPGLFSYSSDATSLLSTTIATGSHHGLQVRRHGRSLHEMLLQRGLLVTMGSLRRGILHTMSAPKSMGNGKSVWHLFAAACDFSTTLRGRGFQGLTLTHFCFDRAVFKPLTTRLTARQEAFYQLAHTQCDDSGLSQLTHIVVSTPCCLHDVHSSLKWAVVKMISDEEIKVIIEENGSLSEKGNLLIEKAKSRGGHDNITLVLVEVE